MYIQTVMPFLRTVPAKRRNWLHLICQAYQLVEWLAYGMLNRNDAGRAHRCRLMFAKAQYRWMRRVAKASVEGA